MRLPTALIYARDLSRHSPTKENKPNNLVCANFILLCSFFTSHERCWGFRCDPFFVHRGDDKGQGRKIERFGAVLTIPAKLSAFRDRAHLVMELAVDGLALVVDQFEGVGAVAVHVAVAVGDAAVGEQEGDLVGGLRTQRDEVPEHVGVLPERRGRSVGDDGGHWSGRHGGSVI